MSLSACSGTSMTTDHSSSLLPPFAGHPTQGARDGIPCDNHPTSGLPFRISHRPVPMFEFLPQLHPSARLQRLLMLYQNIIRINEKMNIIEYQYVLSLASEARACFWAWTRSRQMEISSMACFRYGLPIFFIYLTNESLSNPED